MNCNVAGWYNRNNLGDESYKLAFPKLFPDLNFFFESSAQSCDICIIGGGDILNRHYVKKAIDCPAKKRFAISVSAGTQAPLDLLPELDGIWVRDHRSEEHLKSNGVTCGYMPDVAFGLEPEPEKGVELLEKHFEKEGLELYEKKVAVVLNAHLIHGKEGIRARDLITYLKAAQDIASVADDTSASFVFVPMSTGAPYDDRVTNAFAASRCKWWKKNYVIHERFSVQETLNLIAACDAVISSRLHSSIFSLVSNTPFLDLTHHDKNRSFLETMHLEGYSIPYWSFCSEELRSRLQSLLDNSEAIANKLRWIHQGQLEILKREVGNVRFVEQRQRD